MVCPVCQSTESHEIRRMPDRLGLVPGEFHIAQCENPECGVQYLDPMPDPGVKDPYFEQCWGSERRQGILNRLGNWYNRKLDALELWRLTRRLPAGARVLDIGCGNGDSLEILHRWGFECWGLDQSPAGITAVRDRIPIEVRLGSIYENDLGDGTFDMILMSHVMEHLPEPARAASEVRRLLKPGGIACLMVPNADSLEQRIAGWDWFPYLPPRHVVFYTPKSLAKLMHGAGFKIEQNGFSWLKGGSFVTSLAPKVKNNRIICAMLAALSVPLSIFAVMIGRGAAVMLVAKKS